ncbi:hypothetical protein PILCRDRAFT_813007 [Piloderma croceum F 1598]|uniref:PQ-loop-domain-containing protein n=1 Tax=Piloderma croceum (strain F 1598) TaxID=765440 RepID=A0A0C3BRL0_PILCF|nr:hypothetical protein PILCRDRAFT_813007 [Piloderma croceum F 1598]
MTGDVNILSPVLGGVSIGCWIVVYSPQIIENYQLKSGEGLSVLFVLVWLLGDLCNLFGAILAGLLPTVIILASYYTICDIILLLQIYFYRWDKKRRHSPDGVTEDSPLLDRHHHEDNVNHSRRRIYTLFAQYSGALILVCASGVISWWISTRSDIGGGTPQQPAEPKASEMTIQLFGWTSAILYRE